MSLIGKKVRAKAVVVGDDVDEIIKMSSITETAPTGPLRYVTDSSYYTSNYDLNKFFNYYKKNTLVRKCVNLVAAFTTQAGFETTAKPLHDNVSEAVLKKVKDYVDHVNHLVNLDNVLYVSQIKRHIFGLSCWEISASEEDDTFGKLIPLKSSGVTPVTEDFTFKGVTYPWLKEEFSGQVIPAEKLLYFSNDTLDADANGLLGLSSIEPILRNLLLKENLERDLLLAARSLWAPIVVHQVDTTGMSKEEEKDLFNTLKAQLKPGKALIINKGVESSVTKLEPDLQTLVRAIEKQDEEIIGNWGIPKALLAREKTVSRATLEFSIKAFYQGTIRGEQMYLKREIEKQWYDRIVKHLGYEDDVRVRHEWHPIVGPDSQMVRALALAAKVETANGEHLINTDEFFKILGWDLDRVKINESTGSGTDGNQGD